MCASLNVAVAQPVSLSHAVEANVAEHARLVRAAGARVIVFPELSLTGYELGAEPIAPGDPRLAPLVDACAETGSLALVGAPVPGPHIALLAVDGTGVSVAYRKIYLGGPEPEHFRPGDTPAVLDIDGFRVGLAICKDLGVPEHAANTAALGIDGYVAATAETVENKDLQEKRAHRVATTHGVWVAVASFAGHTGGGFEPATGGSSIRRADGTILAQAGPAPGEFVRAELS
ncbi:carbon-nitrogen hydrolase family protein [Amycolatopsis acidicola]|uniref:Carbon-nitrogen hydrolase family protein n=1 Tax=Amycolatopsis acidicola TaxID=2596893 RepID=A0A5N0UT82_9PSEU|nr:carbon-nitrogen hydrolase family protein [Amycolatopsis acidicola]KAA9153185.1 carbon-nitrogen hydrolase family protein [Amycolatopsis acidicola]